MAETSLPKGYEPWDVEAKWIAYWEEQKTFSPDSWPEGDPYSIVIPPPNVTGKLHIGHALNLTLQDILCRFHRQKGYKVLWVPGTDHAGIATQNVVEKSLAAEGKSREDLGREKFIERVWAWKEEYGGAILNQIRRMGASVDWSRERFTMDEGLSRAVREVFVRLHEEGLIYKGDYIVNWCNRCHTALADLEVEYGPRGGHLYHIRYPLADGSGELIVATTRPETMLGDTAVAVHPEDERYTAFVGKTVVLPLIGREIPVIADAYVDREFGTGALKVTPAHDMNDFELGRKHGLETIQVIDDQGNINANAPEKYRGLSKEKARDVVTADLEAQGFLVNKVEHEHNVGLCYRCQTIVEPHVSPQWFVSVKPLAAVARKAVEEDRTTIFPAAWTKTYFDWLDNIRDWCVSRQIWWGHRIPAWTCQDCGQLIVARQDPTECPQCKGSKLVQESDVLDTWFSSALWPFSTLGWPDQTQDLKTFYPTSVLVTGFDILFFWVARMMMMGLHFKDEVPFRHVYIHALVRDAQGHKMSKSRGNVIDPLVMVDKFGTDSLRFTLTAFAAMGRDIKLAEERIEGYRHFVNKIWNASRFALMNLAGPEGEDKPFEPVALSEVKGLPHSWILHRLEKLKEEVERAITGYHFNEAAQGLYSFVWLELCDWYLEMVKGDLNSEDETAKRAAQTVLLTVLSETLTLLHPIMPFVTQEIWSHLPGERDPNLARVPYPAIRPEWVSDKVEGRMAIIQQVVTSVRNIRAELSIGPSVRLEAVVRAANEEDLACLEANRSLLLSLARLSGLTIGLDVTAPKASASAVIAGGNEVFVPLTGAVDFDAELARLDKEMGKVNKDLEMVNRKLANEDFVARAPADVVGKEKAKAADLQEKQQKLLKLQDRIKAVRG